MRSTSRLATASSVAGIDVSSSASRSARHRWESPRRPHCSGSGVNRNPIRTMSGYGLLRREHRPHLGSLAFAGRTADGDALVGAEVAMVEGDVDYAVAGPKGGGMDMHDGSLVRSKESL